MDRLLMDTYISSISSIPSIINDKIEKTLKKLTCHRTSFILFKAPNHCTRVLAVLPFLKSTDF